MRIRVINLTRAADRRQRMEQQAGKLGLTFEFVAATDARELTESERKWVDRDRRKHVSLYPLSDGEIACWHSHRRMMQDLVDSGENMACVLEDDVVLSPDFTSVLAAIESNHTRFDVIDLHRKFTKGEIFYPCRSLGSGHTLGRVGLMHMGAIGYVISREGAKKFLRYAQRFVHVLDKEMHRYWHSGLDIYGLDHPVVDHEDDGVSYIDETRKQNKPTERIPFPDAHHLRWKVARKWERLKDSIIKRAVFPFYVGQGRCRQRAGKFKLTAP